MKFNFSSLKKKPKIGLHVLAWLLIFSLPIIFSFEAIEEESMSEQAIQFLLLNTFMNIFWVLLFYLNSIVLIPKYLYKRKIWLFIGIEILLFAIFLLLNRLIYDRIISTIPYFFYKALIFNGIPFVFIVNASIASKAASDQIKMDQLTREKESENLKTELSFLRSQISPHFLFNVLNNLVAMVRLKSDELEPTIIKLSSLMQYMLYETDDEKVLLKSELDYLKSYIDLQQLRFGDRLKLNLDFDIEEDWHTIEPMLLIPFVENAFKHGTGMVENPTITISLKEKNNELFFSVKNKYLDEDKVKDKVSGIGLTNVKRRLDLLYSKDHNLSIDQTDGWFSVALKLTLES